jgi:hypothetical protein
MFGLCWVLFAFIDIRFSRLGISKEEDGLNIGSREFFDGEQTDIFPTFGP